MSDTPVIPILKLWPRQTDIQINIQSTTDNPQSFFSRPFIETPLRDGLVTTYWAYNNAISLQPTFKESEEGHFLVTDSFDISGSVGSQLAGHYGRGESREGGKWAGVEGGLAACKYGGEKKNGYLLLLLIQLSLICFTPKLTDPV